MPKYSASFIAEHIPDGIGIYNVYADGRFELDYINDGYYVMLGTTRTDREKFFGTSMAEAIYPEDWEAAKKEITSAIKENRSFQVELRVLTGDGKTYKWLNVRANIVERTSEKTVIFASYSDIDDMKTAKLELDAVYQAMELAGKNAGMSFWIYDMDQHTFRQDYGYTSPFGYDSYMENFPDCLYEINAVHQNDIETMKEMYEKLDQGANQWECTVRVFNRRTQQFEWTQISYARMLDGHRTSRVAVGYSNAVGLQIENQIRYQHEIQLRRQIEQDSLAYFQINLSKHTIEEYYSRLNDIEAEEFPIYIDEEIILKLSAKVLPAYKELVASIFDTSTLLNAYYQGETRQKIEYRRVVENEEIHWVRGEIEVMKRPGAEDIIAFISVSDIELEKVDEEALSCILDEEIESVIIENPETRKVRIVMEKVAWAGKNTGSTFIADDSFDQALLANVVDEDKESCSEFIKMSNIVERLKTESILRITYRIAESDGKIHRKKVRVFYLNDDRDKILIARRDITDLYEEEQKHKRILQNALNEANSANEAKSDFLSRVSHDMRTPLNVILSIAKLVPEERPAYDMMLSYFQTITDEGTFLLRLINDVLDMQKMESGVVELNPEPIDLAGLMNAVIRQAKALADTKDIEFSVTVNGFIENAKSMMDPLRMQQLLTNLISNAIKYTPEKGHVELIMDNLSFENNVATDRITVRDDGYGMSPEFMEKMYEPFSQENGGTTSTTRGTGLGLSIVKKIVELMGGTISCKSELGKGTEFAVILSTPLIVGESSSAPEKIDYSIKNDVSLVGRRILLCEDHPMNAMIANKLLKKKGLIVTHAENGKIGLEYFMNSTQGYYDAVLMDIRMPVMDGLEATKSIRDLDRPDAKTVPIIAMTANAFKEDIEQCLEAGMNEHLAKPINPDQIWEALYRHIDFSKKIPKLKVIIADDIEINAVVVAESIREKYEPVTVYSGADALKYMAEHSDVVALITDIMMPEMDGHELIRTIRSNHQYDNIAIIANTQFGEHAKEEEILKDGADDFIYKPTTPAIVLTRLENVLMRRNNMTRNNPEYKAPIL